MQASATQALERQNTVYINSSQAAGVGAEGLSGLCSALGGGLVPLGCWLPEWALWLLGGRVC